MLVDNADGTAMAQVLFRAKGPVSIGYIPRGPVLAGDVGALWEALWRAIDDIARRRRAISVIVEPNAPLGLTGSFFDAGVVRGPDHVQPSRTVVVPPRRVENVSSEANTSGLISCRCLGTAIVSLYPHCRLPRSCCSGALISPTNSVETFTAACNWMRNCEKVIPSDDIDITAPPSSPMMFA